MNIDETKIAFIPTKYLTMAGKFTNQINKNTWKMCSNEEKLKKYFITC